MLIIDERNRFGQGIDLRNRLRRFFFEETQNIASFLIGFYL